MKLDSKRINDAIDLLLQLRTSIDKPKEWWLVIDDNEVVHEVCTTFDAAHASRSSISVPCNIIRVREVI